MPLYLARSSKYLSKLIDCGIICYNAVPGNRNTQKYKTILWSDISIFFFLSLGKYTFHNSKPFNGNNTQQYSTTIFGYRIMWYPIVCLQMTYTKYYTLLYWLNFIISKRIYEKYCPEIIFRRIFMFICNLKK